MADNEKTSKKMAKLASEILNDDRYSKKAKSVAGALLTQAPDNSKPKPPPTKKKS